MIMKKRLFLASAASLVAVGVFLGAAVASAQTAVAIQQQYFGSHGDGSSNSSAVPCCTSMGTYDTRTVSSMHPPDTMNRGGPYFAEFNLRRQYATAQVGAVGGDGKRPVTVPDGVFSTNTTLPFITLPGGNLLGIDTMLLRDVDELNFNSGGGVAAAYLGTGNFTAAAIADGNEFFSYNAADHIPTITPTFRTSMEFTDNVSHAGRIRVTPSADQYGGVRDQIWDQFAHGFVPGPTTASVAEFNFVVRYGPGVGLPAVFGYNFTTPTTTTAPTTNNTFMASDVIRRSTASAPFKLRQTPGTMGACCTGATIVALDGTGWFDFFDYTTGTIQVLANTVGTIYDDFSTRTEMGSYAISTTSMGAIVGQMQLVSGGLLNSRGAQYSNLSHTQNTVIKFAPEPGSAALISAGALGLIGLVIRDRKRNRA
jgi:hypothetical protein